MAQQKQVIEFTEEEIETLRDIAGDKELLEDDEIEDLKKLRRKVTLNDVLLGVLTLKCFDILSLTAREFLDDDNDYTQRILLLLNDYNFEDIRYFVADYGGGKEYGDYIAERNILAHVGERREKYLELVRLFFKIFGGDD